MKLQHIEGMHNWNKKKVKLQYIEGRRNANDSSDSVEIHMKSGYKDWQVHMHKNNFYSKTNVVPTGNSMEEVPGVTLFTSDGITDSTNYVR